MIELFVPYNETLELKSLGIGKSITYACGFYYTLNNKKYKFATPSQFDIIDETYNVGGNFYMVAPIYEQAFKFFRDKHDLAGFIIPFGESLHDYRIYNNVDGEHLWSSPEFNTYEEAQLECLRKLIGICKKK